LVRPPSGAVLLSQPAFDFFSTVLSFPLFQLLMIAAFGFDYFTGMRILVLL
jgi:hypothetical protein